MKVVLIDMLQEAGVDLLLHVFAASPIIEEKTVKGIFFETLVGRKAILSKVVVDCTGEADIIISRKAVI